MSTSAPFARHPRRLLVVAVAGALTVALSGCAQVADAFNQFQQSAGAPAAAATPTPLASPSMDFDSQFTYDGSVALSTEVADQLEVRLDVWASDPKRTQEWTPTRMKTLGFAVNVHDHRVDEKAVLTDKRRVYLSSVSVTSQTAQTSGQVQSPFQFSADPRTLVPTDTLRSDRGLLLNSFQGGLLVPETTISQLPEDTYGITLEFALTVWVEGNANDENSFQQQTVYQYLPVAIYPDGTAAVAGSSTQP
ncbi:fructose 1,6-bisphosphatase [Microbacterium invictum]|uniref:Fructose 1,6-bisphosphatase n=1 Tax=Microbacterium invictum TaxID=515415 RepID=A0ABZ0V8K3_9MICO|nr:fructose 1,6-bisphosphatase [Microbacterium invictum]WQB69955.1 fructose 1,6-bisphosphatase [Microbacterium invictum]